MALVLRARATAELAGALDADLEQRGAAAARRASNCRWSAVLARMERAGIAADTHHFADMSASLGGEVKAAEQAAFTIIGHEFNLGSPKQLQEVLFTELGLPKTKRIKTGYTTDSEALTSLLAQTGHPVLEHLLRHRDVARLKSIVDSLIPMADEDGRIHTTYNQMIAATGRLSSTDPNLQNIPIRTEEGRRIRQGFVVGAGTRRCSPPTTARSSCASWPTCPATPRWRRRSPPATTSTPRRRPGSSACRPRRSRPRCAAGSRR